MRLPRGDCEIGYLKRPTIAAAHDEAAFVAGDHLTGHCGVPGGFGPWTRRPDGEALGLRLGECARIRPSARADQPIDPRRSAARRVGKECVSPCTSTWPPAP